MQSTFDSFNSFKLTLLFSSWRIESNSQFAFAWICVFAASIFHRNWHHAVDYLQRKMAPLEDDKKLAENSRDTSYSSRGHIWLRRRRQVLASAVAAARYGVSLLLMLVGMTFNASLFLALVLGHFVGDVCEPFLVTPTGALRRMPSRNVVHLWPDDSDTTGSSEISSALSDQQTCDSELVPLNGLSHRKPGYASTTPGAAALYHDTEIGSVLGSTPPPSSTSSPPKGGEARTNSAHSAPKSSSN